MSEQSDHMFDGPRSSEPRGCSWARNMKMSTLIRKWKLDLDQSVSKKSTSDKHSLCQSFFHYSECQDQGHQSEALNLPPIRKFSF